MQTPCYRARFPGRTEISHRYVKQGTLLFVENYVAQQLKARMDIALYYWSSKGKKAELDFLCEIDAAVLPLEARAGINPKSKRLRSFDNQFNPRVLLRTSLLNLKKDGKICNIPLYAIAMLADYVKRIP